MAAVLETYDSNAWDRMRDIQNAFDKKVFSQHLRGNDLDATRRREVDRDWCLAAMMERESWFAQFKTADDFTRHAKSRQTIPSALKGRFGDAARNLRQSSLGPVMRLWGKTLNIAPESLQSDRDHKRWSDFLVVPMGKSSRSDTIQTVVTASTDHGRKINLCLTEWPLKPHPSIHEDKENLKRVTQAALDALPEKKGDLTVCLYRPVETILKQESFAIQDITQTSQGLVCGREKPKYLNAVPLSVSLSLTSQLGTPEEIRAKTKELYDSGAEDDEIMRMESIHTAQVLRGFRQAVLKSTSPS